LGWVDHIARHHDFEVANVFHAGDGNLHPLILYNANDEEELLRAEACGAELLRLCVKAGGCLTGEHGVGIEKRDLMLDQYGPVDLEAQMAIKDVFDPSWLLNPAKVFPLAVSAPRREISIAAE
jgi:glycolate oxidase